MVLFLSSGGGFNIPKAATLWDAIEQWMSGDFCMKGGLRAIIFGLARGGNYVQLCQWDLLVKTFAGLCLFLHAIVGRSSTPWLVYSSD